MTTDPATAEAFDLALTAELDHPRLRELVRDPALDQGVLTVLVTRLFSAKRTRSAAEQSLGALLAIHPRLVRDHWLLLASSRAEELAQNPMLPLLLLEDPRLPDDFLFQLAHGLRPALVDFLASHPRPRVVRSFASWLTAIPQTKHDPTYTAERLDYARALRNAGSFGDFHADVLPGHIDTWVRTPLATLASPAQVWQLRRLAQKLRGHGGPWSRWWAWVGAEPEKKAWERT